MKELPCADEERLEAFEEMRRMLVEDTITNLTLMHYGAGVPVQAAAQLYREWLHDLVNDAVDGGVAEWAWIGSEDGDG